MTHINKDEVLKIARLSNVMVYDSEISTFLKQLDSVLAYAIRVSEIKQQPQQESKKIDMEYNVLRKDEVAQFNVQQVLEVVPVRDENLIIVPMILEGV